MYLHRVGRAGRFGTKAAVEDFGDFGLPAIPKPSVPLR